MTGRSAPRGFCGRGRRVEAFRPEACQPCPLPSMGHDGSREDAMNSPTSNAIDRADEAQLLATIDRWIEREVAPRVKEFDHADRWPAELVEQMKELGLFGATVSPDYGGLGLPARPYAEIVMRVSSVWMALTGIFNS